ncbi:uncharacterized protein LOC110944328 [Helianthus annuus]|uniref:uncharacterized protein LOC110944328 n=1 Tax=Helianthus annuus TaxID=4232 RepID=UPI000B905767|nr:uncharacterized protein LOC110944328 [Helianthus annuus]
MALSRRNIMGENLFCVWCETSDESIEHVLTGCPVSAGVWNAITNWCRIPGMFVFHVKDLVEFHEHCGVSGIYKTVIHGIIIIACWRMWKARNDKVFANKDTSVAEMVADIKSLGFLCYKHRLKQGVVDWDSRIDGSNLI